MMIFLIYCYVMKIWNIYQTIVLNVNHTSVNLTSMNNVIHSNFATFIKARLKNLLHKVHHMEFVTKIFQMRLLLKVIQNF